MRILIALFLAIALPIETSAAETWETVKPDGLGFSVEIPGKPEYTEMTDDFGDGKSGLIRTYVVKSPAAAYDVTIFDLPEGAVGPDDVERVLDNMRDQSIQNVRGQLRAETKIDIGGHQARDVTAETMGMVWRSRLVIAKGKIYQVVAIVSKAAEQSETTIKYLASFKLLDDTDGGQKK
ncbi:MAG: hypothetical protein ABL894_14390 [Hyphomicrobium sp.]